MRQAFIVTNPKWELFTKASDAFKSAASGAVLVVRGRCKENRAKGGESKVFKKSAESLAKEIADAAKKAAEAAKKAAAILAIVFLSVSAFAQADITVNLPVTTLDGSSTNAGPGNGLIGWNYGDIAVLQCAVITTNVAHISTRSNVVVRFDTSLNGTDWLTDQYELSIPVASTTNANSTISLLTNTVGGKWLRIGACENVNTNRVTFQRFYFQKLD